MPPGEAVSCVVWVSGIRQVFKNNVTSAAVFPLRKLRKESGIRKWNKKTISVGNGHCHKCYMILRSHNWGYSSLLLKSLHLGGHAPKLTLGDLGFEVGMGPKWW